MTQIRDLIKKMADFFTCEEFYEKGEDARLELSPDDVRCMNYLIHQQRNKALEQEYCYVPDTDIGKMSKITKCKNCEYYSNPDYTRCHECKMTNGDLFQSIFNIYATELWSKPEAEFLEWLNSECKYPQPNTGHWIYDDECHEHGHCSECGYGRVDLVNGESHNFCRQCGVKMIYPQESSAGIKQCYIGLVSHRKAVKHE